MGETLEDTLIAEILQDLSYPAHAGSHCADDIMLPTRCQCLCLFISQEAEAAEKGFPVR